MLSQPGLKAESVTSRTARPGVGKLIQARSHTFLMIDHEIISTGILLLPLIQEGLLSVIREDRGLSGRVLDSRPRGHGCEPHWHHCVVFLSKTP